MCTQDVCAPCSFLLCFEKMLLGNLPRIPPLSRISFFFPLFLLDAWLLSLWGGESDVEMRACSARWRGWGHIVARPRHFRPSDLFEISGCFWAWLSCRIGSVVNCRLERWKWGRLKWKYSCGKIYKRLWGRLTVVGQPLQPWFMLMCMEF